MEATPEPTMASWLAGRAVIVAAQGPDVGSAVARSLAARGARVALLTDEATPGHRLADAPAPVDFTSRSAVADAFAAAANGIGRPAAVIHSAMPAGALTSAPVDRLGHDEWRVAALAALKTTLYCLQASFAQMAGQGGTILLLGPASALVGASGLVALSTAVEGQRGLMKSAARQWGRHGITLNWVAAGAAALSARLEGSEQPTRPDAVPVALGRRPDLGTEIVPVLEFLAGPAGRAITGTTMLLDGGEWMVP